MKDRKVLGGPMILGLILIGVCLIGIIIGSFLDFEISKCLSNKTEIGTWFANYGGYFSYCLRFRRSRTAFADQYAEWIS